MMLRGTLQMTIRLTFIFSLAIKVDSVPMKRLSRMVREVYPEIEPDSEGNQAQVCIVGDVVYGMDENVPAEQPCLKCKCQPPGVQCETIQCAKRPGCKAIHKPNKCCPDYQCECEHNGKIYPNGEKLETPPGGECKVCYCRGGEVQCAEVSCYIRTDCEGKRVPGTCCPRYDHCPPIDPIPNRPLYTTDIIISNSKDQFEVWPITIPPPNSTESIMGPTPNDFQEENKIPDTNSYDTTTSSYQVADPINVEKDAAVIVHRITIQEIIPERKEIPITAPPKKEIEPQGTLLIEEAADLSNNSNDLGISDTDVESSEISETFQQPPPVLKVGNKLLFLKEGEFVHEKDATEPSSVITVVGAEGLQRGGVEDSGEAHEIKIETDTEVDKNMTTAEEENSDYNDTLSLNTAASTHILSLVKRKNKPTISTTQAPITEATEQPPWVSSSTSAESIEIVTDIGIGNASDIEETQTTAGELTVNTTEEIADISKVEPITSTANVKHYDVITELNPAYPPLPEIISPNMEDTSQKFENDNTENVTRNIETKILPQILEIRSNKTVPQNVSNSEWLKINTKTLLNPNASLPDDLLMQMAPTDVEENEDVFEIGTEIPDSTTMSGYANKEEDKIGNLTTVESRRSIETIEDSSEGSKEVTTPKNKHASLLSTEDASVESGRETSSEVDDMVEPREGNDSEFVESTTMRDLIDHINANNNTETDNKPIDVEFVDTTKLKKQKPILEKSLSEDDQERERSPRSKKSEQPLNIKKRDSTGKDDENEEELTEENFGSDEEKKEADAIFRELLEDTSTSKPTATMNREIETLSRVSNALEQLSLRGGTTDTNILGILSNFFSSQYRD